MGASPTTDLGERCKRRLRRVRSRLLGTPPPRNPWPYQDIGEHTVRGHEVVYYPGDPAVWVRIGNYSSLGTGAQLIVGAIHRTDWVSTFPFRAALSLSGAFADGNPTSRGDIVIGSDCWIARDVTVLSGVTIGHGAIVGIGAVVTRDVRPYAVVAGNPAREVRRRYPDKVCERLLEIAWWDWPHSEVLAAVPLLNGGSITAFLDYAAARATPASSR